MIIESKYKNNWKEEINNMAPHRAKNKTTAKEQAMEARKKGFVATPYKKKKGYGVSVTRK